MYYSLKLPYPIYWWPWNTIVTQYVGPGRLVSSLTHSSCTLISPFSQKKKNEGIISCVAWNHITFLGNHNETISLKMSPIPHINFFFKNCSNGDFLAVQWLRLHVSNEGGTGSIPGRVTKIPHATWPKKKKPKTKTQQ